MEPQGQPEVLFCDLCNTSVPLQDFDSGQAVRHQGKAIGPCCLATLRGTGAAGAGVAGASGGGRSSPADSRVLPLGIALLGAIAAATLFLDFRIDQVDTRSQQRAEGLGESLKSQANVVQGVSEALDSVVRRADFDDLGQRLGALDASQRGIGKEVEALGAGHVRAIAAVTAVQQSVRDMETRRPDYGPILTELRVQLQQQAVSLAELLAKPRTADAAAATVLPDRPAAPPGVGPELAHQIQRLGDDDAATRFEAVDELLRSKNPDVLEHLLPMAKDADTFVRRLVVEGLKDFVKPAVVDALITALADPEEIVRDTAWRSLKELTAQKLPFDASGGREARNRAQQKWQEWWDKNRDSLGS